MRFHLIWLLFAGIAAGQTITTFAGNGTAGYSGDMGPANHAQINRVVGLATDSAGNIYMAEENSNVVRKVDTNGNITTIAGTSVSGFTGDGGPATQARLAAPTGVCVSSTGDVYVNDLTNRRVRKITAATGIITTVAGNGSAVSTGDGGPATSAGLFLPIRCAVDLSGNLFIVDQGAHVIRKVNTSGTIITYAGINNTANFFGDGGPANQAAMNNPTAAFADTSGNLYVTDQSNHRIRKIDASGTITSVAGNGSPTFAGDGGLAIAASLNFPGETALDSAGSLFIMDTVNDVVRKVAGGTISTVAGTHGVAGYAGDGGPPLQAQFSNAFALTIDPSGNLYVSDTTNNRVRIITGVALGQTSSCTYTLNPAAQAFPAAGGSGSIAIATQAGCAWSLASGPSWVTGATAGSGTGTLTFQVVANTGEARFATLTIAGQSFSIEQQAVSVPGLTLIGSMAHLAAQENWTTTFTLVNKSSASSTARLSFFGDALDPTGNGPLTLPLTFPQQAAAALPLGVLTGGPLLASSFDRTIAANASLIVTTAGPQTPPVLVGSAQLAATGAVDGFAIFHQIPTAQEAVVPMETRSAPSYLLAFDNTSGLVLGVAVENLSPQAAVIPVIIRDDNGTVISSLGATISLGGNGHTAFVLSDATNGFPVTANIRGTIEFDTPAGGQISVLGLRFTPPNSALTTIPALANVPTGGGSIAHLASGGDGWQTTFVLVNTGTSAAQVTLSFFADQTGAPLSLPLSFPQPGGGADTVATSYQKLLPAGASLYIVSTGAGNLLTGSAQLTTTGHVSGFVIFRHNNQEAVVPLESRNASGYIIAFDNTNGTATGIAVNAVSAGQVSVPVVVRDDTGAQIAADTIVLAPNGHYAFTLGVDKYSAARTIRGTIEIDTPAGAQIGGLGIRIPSGAAHTYTTLPALAK